MVQNLVWRQDYFFNFFSHPVIHQFLTHTHRTNYYILSREEMAMKIGLTEARIQVHLVINALNCWTTNHLPYKIFYLRPCGIGRRYRSAQFPSLFSCHLSIQMWAVWDKLLSWFSEWQGKMPSECFKNCLRNVEQSLSSEDSFGGIKTALFQSQGDYGTDV